MKTMVRLLLLTLCLFATLNIYGHDVDVTGITRVFLEQLSENQYRLSVLDQPVPPVGDLNNSLPQRCQVQDIRYSIYEFSCDTPLTTADTISLPWSLEGVVAVARWEDASEASAYFRGDGVFVDIQLSQLNASVGTRLQLAGRYLYLGAEHILLGLDHLLFIVGLLLLIHGSWSLVKTLTAFTVAHSITLGSVVLGFLPVPGAPIDAIIALSIVLLGREILQAESGEINLVHRFPWIVAFIFGLFHGFGFAGALTEIGLRRDDVPFALLFFNLGVEAGQIGFVAVLLSYRNLLRNSLQDWHAPARQVVAYGLGGIATFWFLQRLPPVLGL